MTSRKVNTITADTYGGWLTAARASDDLAGRSEWRESDASPHFDYAAVRHRLAELRRLRAAGDDRGLLFALDEGIHGNMDGIGNAALWHEARSGTKLLIENYVDEIALALDHLADLGSMTISREEKLAFFQRASRCFGRSALLFSGAGSYLYFHVGVAQALLQQGLLPKIICGSSGGALVAAILCTHSSEALHDKLSGEFLAESAPGPDPQRSGLPTLHAIVSQEAVWDGICRTLPDVTFAEALDVSGRALNISVAPAERHQNGRLLNAITSPHACIREAVLASCAVPGVFKPVALMARDSTGRRVPYIANRRWVDGSVTHDLPSKRLSRIYFANHFIVSQAHPLIAPLSDDAEQLPTLYNTVKKATTMTMKGWFSIAMRLLDQPLSLVPPLHELASMMASVVNQDYSGDINIIRPAMFWPPSKVLSPLNLEEAERLIDIGKRCAWPKMERIRVQTKIGRTLDEISTRLDMTV